jgi:predicted ArsR family transcriptional regulator
MKVDLTRVERIDFLIRKKSTGTPKELAKKLGLSVRAWALQSLIQKH